ATIDELTLVVVAELDVLGRAEGVQRIEPLLRLEEGKRAARHEHDAHEREHDAELLQPSVHRSLPFSLLKPLGSCYLHCGRSGGGFILAERTLHEARRPLRPGP